MKQQKKIAKAENQSVNQVSISSQDMAAEEKIMQIIDELEKMLDDPAMSTDKELKEELEKQLETQKEQLIKEVRFKLLAEKQKKLPPKKELEITQQEVNLDKGQHDNQSNNKVLQMPKRDEEVEGELPKEVEINVSSQPTPSLSENAENLTISQFFREVEESTDPKQLAKGLEITIKMSEAVESRIKTVCDIETDGKIGLKKTWSKYVTKDGEEKTHIHEQFRYTNKATGESTSLAVNKASKKAR